MKFITTKEIIVEAKAGARFDLCVNEACRMSLKREADVRLIHNDTEYVVRHTSLVAQLVASNEA